MNPEQPESQSVPSIEPGLWFDIELNNLPTG